jgi:nonribosomal peptide synthetase DhbF
MVLVHRSLHGRYLQVCARQPTRTAVVCGPESLTYEELAAEAHGLAGELVRQGVRPGELVGLRVDRSVDSAVGILGILLAGAAYVPLDPQYPAGRLELIAEEAGITRVVGDGVPIRGHRADPAARLPAVEPGDRAYVIYTSGSTGRPKGCVIRHGNVLSLLDGALPLFDVGPDDRWTLFHSISFDFSVWELWGALATGGTVVIVDAEAAFDPDAFLQLLVKQRVTVLNQVPPVFRSLAEAHAEAGHPPLALRYLIFGGDAVDLDTTAAFLHGHPPGLRAVNMYGITETTVHVTYKELDEATLHGTDPSPIGRALPHLRVTLRDPHGFPVPDGTPGEMWVSGGGVGAGYLGRDDLTAERFVTVDGVRHYRSGDLACRGPGGELRYLGRIDRQVKLRGFRIELPEIEAVLRRCSGVRDAVVELATEPPVGDLLVAYVVADEPFDVRPARDECRRQLPSYMVPARFVAVPAIPLTASGKVDRAVLAQR